MLSGGIRAGLEHRDTVASLRLGRVERAVGALGKRIEVVAMLAVGGDADADRARHRRRARGKRGFRDADADALGDDRGALAAGFRQQAHELVAARSEEPRLNSSHSQISYAVFCLKKKKKKKKKYKKTKDKIKQT